MKKYDNLNGWLNFNKPYGYSSFKTINLVKNILKIKKLGHAGTLDPIATGVLPIAIGEATKTLSYVFESDKSYKFTVTWGYQTSTDDIEGKIIKSTKRRPSKDQITSVIENYIGEIMQKPPDYSAIKINGQRAYKLARSGQKIKLDKRKVCIYDLTLDKIIDDDTALFVLKCSKGTYVRSLARDIGAELGVFAHVKRLQRTSVGNFIEKNSISLDQLIELKQDASTKDLILPIFSPINKSKLIDVGVDCKNKLINGIKIPYLTKNLNCLKNGDFIFTQYLNDPVAICLFQDGSLKPKRVFNIFRH